MNISKAQPVLLCHALIGVVQRGNLPSVGEGEVEAAAQAQAITGGFGF